MYNLQMSTTLSKADIADMILSYSAEALESFMALANAEVRMMFKKMQRLSEEELLKIASESMDFMVTSPPYWGILNWMSLWKERNFRSSIILKDLVNARSFFFFPKKYKKVLHVSSFSVIINITF